MSRGKLSAAPCLETGPTEGRHNLKRFITACVVAVSLIVGVTAASAATYVVVTPTNPHGWSTADTRPGGQVNFVVDATAPRGVGALQLTTDATITAKAQFL